MNMRTVTGLERLLTSPRCGGLLAGGLTSTSRGGWRSLFWVEAGLHLTASLGLLLFYHPPRKSDYPRMSVRKYIWACDPIGSSVFVVGATLILLGLNWAGNEYAWANAHVAAVLSIGLALLCLFGLYGKFPRVMAYHSFDDN
jgi:hypothetical protein